MSYIHWLLLGHMAPDKKFPAKSFRRGEQWRSVGTVLPVNFARWCTWAEREEAEVWICHWIWAFHTEAFWSVNGYGRNEETTVSTPFSGVSGVKLRCFSCLIKLFGDHKIIYITLVLLFVVWLGYNRELLILRRGRLFPILSIARATNIILAGK